MPLLNDKTTIGEFDLYLWMSWLPNAVSGIRRFICLHQNKPGIPLQADFTQAVEERTFSYSFHSFSLKFSS